LFMAAVARNTKSSLLEIKKRIGRIPVSVQCATQFSTASGI